MKRKSVCFRDEIRKSLIVHALAPCILSLIVLGGLFAAVGFLQIVGKNNRVRQRFSKEYEALINQYAKENDAISRSISLKQFSQSSSYRVAAVSGIYQFLNRQKIRGDFYLFDQDKRPVFSTQGSEEEAGYIGNYMAERDLDHNGRSGIVFIYNAPEPGGKAVPAWLIVSPVMMDGRVEGYSGFLLPSDRFAADMEAQVQVLVTNRFYRIFTKEAGRYEDDRGKLSKAFRGKSGLVLFGGKWYYFSNHWILDGIARVYAIYDCTFFVQFGIIFAGLIVFVTAVMVGAIYHSAGRVADKKTVILYELIAALDQVEKGDLTVHLEIATGDEFERIGKSFNMMLGSIRHLIARHQELAKENLLASVQILESQFNPHFLFNTLESIRYMIQFDREYAKKMIVGLSRLLRYSIQNGREKAGLLEEIGFIDRYLQIMLYRYGDRLNYQIKVEEECKGMTVPRMMLQPLVENSIKYGFGDCLDELQIGVRAELEGKNLLIIISDNGVGIDRLLLAELTENLNQAHNGSNHIGIYNVNKRIKLMYGKDCGLSIKSEKGKGTTVRLVIPGEAVAAYEGESGDAVERCDC